MPTGAIGRRSVNRCDGRGLIGHEPDVTQGDSANDDLRFGKTALKPRRLNPSLHVSADCVRVVGLGEVFQRDAVSSYLPEQVLIAEGVVHVVP